MKLKISKDVFAIDIAVYNIITFYLVFSEVPVILKNKFIGSILSVYLCHTTTKEVIFLALIDSLDGKGNSLKFVSVFL